VLEFHQSATSCPQTIMLALRTDASDVNYRPRAVNGMAGREGKR